MLTITCASTLAEAVLFSIGRAGLVAVTILQAQAYFWQASSITAICAGMYRSEAVTAPQPFVALADLLANVAQVFAASGAMLINFCQIVHNPLAL